MNKETINGSVLVSTSVFFCFLFIDVSFNTFVDIVGGGRAAGYTVLKEFGTVADSELAGLAAVALADTDFSVEIIEDTFVFKTGEGFHEAFVAGAASVHFFCFVL